MRKSSTVAAAMIAMMASPAMASEWWLVFTGGERPSRLLVAVDEAFLDPIPFAENTYKLEIFSLMENEKAPDSVSSNIIVDCKRKTLEEKLIQISPRDDFVKTAPDQPAHPPTDAVDRKLLEFACEMGPKKEAERLAMRKLNLTDRGLLFMGPLTTGDIRDFTWKNLWDDGTRPVVANKRSQKEIDAKMAELAQRRTAALAEANAIAAGVVETDKKDAARAKEVMDLTAANAAIAKARDRREPRDVRNALDPWIRQTEAELLRVWGPPTDSRDQGGKRVLSYYKSTVETITANTQGCPKGELPQPVDGPDKPPRCMPMAGLEDRQVTHECTASFEFRDGRIIDYLTRGSNNQGNAYSSCSAVFGKSN